MLGELHVMLGELHVGGKDNVGYQKVKKIRKNWSRRIWATSNLSFFADSASCSSKFHSFLLNSFSLSIFLIYLFIYLLLLFFFFVGSGYKLHHLMQVHYQTQNPTSHRSSLSNSKPHDP